MQARSRPYAVIDGGRAYLYGTRTPPRTAAQEQYGWPRRMRRDVPFRSLSAALYLCPQTVAGTAAGTGAPPFSSASDPSNASMR